MLWFVGDYASFDPRSQRVTRALARLLHAGRRGLRDPLRRRAQRRQRRAPRGRGGPVRGARRAQHRDARRSASSSASSRATRTRSTRCATSTPTTAARGRSSHHTALLLELIEDGPARHRRAAGVPGHLPRPVLPRPPQRRLRRAARGSCGGSAASWSRCRATVTTRSAAAPAAAASGSRTRPARERPSENRIREAVALGTLDCFVVSCPKDVTMFEDAIKTSGNADEIELRGADRAGAGGAGGGSRRRWGGLRPPVHVWPSRSRS